MIEQDIADIQKKIIEAEDLLNTVQIKKYELKKELVDVMETIRKGEHNLSKLKMDEKIKIREFWNQKNNREGDSYGQ